MPNDEDSIQQWFDQWLTATIEGELELARTLIADDAVFMIPGFGTMGKEPFAAAATASDPNTDFELDCSIEGMEVIGDHAWLQSKIHLGMTNKASGSRSAMAGHALTVLRRQGESWVVIREANTMVAVPQ